MAINRSMRDFVLLGLRLNLQQEQRDARVIQADLLHSSARQPISLLSYGEKKYATFFITCLN